MKEVFSVLAGVLFVVGFIPYIRAIWRDRHLLAGTPGKAEPRKVSWVIWASLDTITTAGMVDQGTLNGQIVAAVAGAWVVAALAWRYGASGWTTLDRCCFGGAFLAIVLWKVFGDSLFGIVTSLVVVSLGSIPTFVSAWKDPGREDKLAWTIFWVSCVCAVIAIPEWRLADAAQPIAFFAIETMMMYVLYVRPRTDAVAS